MILYTPLEILDIFSDSNQQKSKHKIIEIDGTKLLVEDDDTQQYRIVQLISTNPYDYLKTDFQPGAWLERK